MNSIIGWNCSIGQWSRVEGTPSDPNPNDPFARLDSDSMFDEDGRLTPSITILGISLNSLISISSYVVGVKQAVIK